MFQLHHRVNITLIFPLAWKQLCRSVCLKGPNDRYANVKVLLQALEQNSDLEELTIVVPIKASIPPQPLIHETTGHMLTFSEPEGISEQAMNRDATPIPPLRSRRGLISAVIVLILLLLAAIFVVYPWVVEQLDSSGGVPSAILSLEHLIAFMN